MERELIGTPFILLAAALLTPVTMLVPYRYLRSPERARAISALAIFVCAPLVAFGTVRWRWGVDELDDSPAAGLPYFAAAYETFWIWCASMIALLVLHAPMTKMGEILRPSDKSDPDVFE
ncbi:hypothetical protein [Alteriqipengyuania lutimaris]|uniref:Uncharacterized protein n=1 Tax=Alteriqipengyuania lutimaris TaxID=1538146 RepID=A0A395LGS7_9SPHN|nr:hypothetical protein [Alteriqipengyuania lutimaris]MBB3035176.1 hypothetical protein [Alteriqipengyuania lutimaris]RDS75789.1 hypothetical protein DL238_13900 [Alteriqipengyuania lutimaris]